MNQEQIERLYKISKEIGSLEDVGCVLQWDQETNIPQGSHSSRSSQLGELNKVIHQRWVEAELGELLELGSKSNLNTKDAALVRVMSRFRKYKTVLSQDLVEEESKLTSESMQAWVKSREDNNFEVFKPFLSRLVEINQEKARLFGYKDSPYDALVDQFAEGFSTEIINIEFKKISDRLPEIIKEAVAKQKTVKFDLNLEKQKQIEVSKSFLELMCFDFNEGRLDEVRHPFMERAGEDDFRVTNRYSPDKIDFIFSAIHEGGHALYEQGIAKELRSNHLSRSQSLAIHESQSRLWENIIGRSNEFWEGENFDYFKKTLGGGLENVSFEDFMTYTNKVDPAFIRVEADELTYDLHIIIRYEIEQALIEGTLGIDDVESAWNAKYKDYLGVEVDTVKNGVMQDVHWSHGVLGYFPSYSLGNIYATQIWNKYQEYDPSYQETIATGNLAKIKDWLTANIYGTGAIKTPMDTMTDLLGEQLSSEAYLERLEKRYL